MSYTPDARYIDFLNALMVAHVPYDLSPLQERYFKLLATQRVDNPQLPWVLITDSAILVVRVYRELERKGWVRMTAVDNAFLVESFVF